MIPKYAVVLVHSTSYAMRLERLLDDAGIPSKMIPVPRHISSDCGVCVRIRYEDIDTVRRIAEAAHMEVEGLQAI